MFAGVLLPSLGQLDAAAIAQLKLDGPARRRSNAKMRSEWAAEQAPAAGQSPDAEKMCQFH